MAPLSEKDIRAAEAEHVVRAPVKSRVVLPVQVVPKLIAALQEQLRIYTESAGNAGRGPIHYGNRRSAILRKLYTQHPGADTELDYKNPYQLLVATILSAQSTDAGVNRVTPALFKRYPNAAALAAAHADELEPQIHSTGFFRSKAKSLMGMARALVERHGGEVPEDDGCARRTAGRGTKDRKRRARTRARRAGAAGRSSRAAGVEPDWHRPLRRSR